MCEPGCICCARFGPTREEHDRRLQEFIDAEVARIRHFFDSPEGQAVIDRHLRALRRAGWRSPGEGA